MSKAPITGAAVGLVLLIAIMWGVQSQVGAAEQRLKTGAVEVERPKVATADDAEAAYCTPKFKQVLQRVLHACGLLSGKRRGCQPADVQRLAAISDEEFNELFAPLEKRGAVIMFDDGSDKLDDKSKQLVEQTWEDRRGARYFFVVARASKTGTRKFNQALSHKRANSVKFDVEDKFEEKDLEKKVGMMWLGYDFAQLGKEYCSWNVSRPGNRCTVQAINRSAFISWVDCRL